MGCIDMFQTPSIGCCSQDSKGFGDVTPNQFHTACLAYLMQLTLRYRKPHPYGQKDP